MQSSQCVIGEMTEETSSDAYLSAASLQFVSRHGQCFLIGQTECLGHAVHVVNLQGRQLELVGNSIDNKLDSLNLESTTDTMES